MKRYLYIGLLAVVLAGPVRADESATTREAASQDATTLVEAGSPTEAIMFYLVGGVAALSALGCVLSVNIVRMAVCLFTTLGSVAILYFLMAANFLGAIQLIVYAGGTLIVIIFGVMLTSKSPWVKFVPKRIELIAGAMVCMALLVGLSIALRFTNWSAAQPKPAGYSVEQFGTALLTTYLVPFELASVLLLAVMIGAAYLARAERK